MDPLWAFFGVLALVALAGALGLWSRARSGSKKRSTTTTNVEASDIGLTALGANATIVQFSTEFCARCPSVKRALPAVAAESDGVAFTDVDLTHRTDLASRYRVLQTPTVLVLDPHGAVHARYSGAVTARSISAELASMKEESHVSA